MSSICKTQSESSVPWIRFTLSKVKGFCEIKLELMEPQKQVRLETLLHAFCFLKFLCLSYVDGVGSMLPYPPVMILL